MRALVLVIVTALVTAGCASPPKHEPPEIRVDVPDAWTAEAESPPPGQADTLQWWHGFADSALNGLVDEALNHNFNIQAAVARVDAAAAQARIAGADLWPQAGLNFDAARRQQNLLGIAIPGAPDVITARTNSFGVSLDILWEVDLWGRVRSAKSAALADLQASWADLAAVRLSIAGQTVKAWFAVIETMLQLELARETVRTFQLSADQVRERYEQGVRTSLDYRLALANLYAAEALVEVRREQLDRVTRQLEILLGRYPASTLSAGADLPAVVGDVPPGLPSEILLRRPDLFAAERRFAASEKRVSEARRAFFPRITLTGSGGSLTAQLGDLVDGDFSVWSIAAGLTQPIFQGGRLRANLSRSHAVSDQTLADYALSLLSAFGEVESSLFSERVLATRELATAKAAEQSEAARLLAERQYDAGIVDYITVLETQRRALSSQSELLVVRRARLDARVNLYLALGGGFDLGGEWMEFMAAQTETKNTDTPNTEDSGE